MDETREQVAQWLHAQLPGTHLLGAGTVQIHQQPVRAELLSVPAGVMLKVPGVLARARKQFPRKNVRMVMWKGKVRLQVVDLPEPSKNLPAPSTPAAPSPRLSRWSRPTRFGKLQVQSQHGTEAVVMPLKEGLWIVSEVPSQAVREYGIAPFIPGALRAVGKLMRPEAPPQPQVVVVQQPGPAPATPAAPVAQPPQPARRRRLRAAPAWMGADDAAFLGMDLGCAACRGRCGSGS